MFTRKIVSLPENLDLLRDFALDLTQKQSSGGVL